MLKVLLLVMLIIILLPFILCLAPLVLIYGLFDRYMDYRELKNNYKKKKIIKQIQSVNDWANDSNEGTK